MFQALMMATALVAPDASKIADGKACYEIWQGSGMIMTIGNALQTVSRGEDNGVPTVHVTVHQKVSDRFDMEDRFVLSATDLRPVRLDTTRNGKAHAHLDYTTGRVVGWVEDKDGRRAIDQALSGPVWEGSLWGLNIAALPLAEGAHFTLPYFQYDSGLGTFDVTVTEKKTVDLPDGATDVWMVDLTPFPGGPVVHYAIGADGSELAYRTDEGGQSLGGDCAGME